MLNDCIINNLLNSKGTKFSPDSTLVDINIELLNLSVRCHLILNKWCTAFYIIEYTCFSFKSTLFSFSHNRNVHHILCKHEPNSLWIFWSNLRPLNFQLFTNLSLKLPEVPLNKMQYIRQHPFMKMCFLKKIFIKKIIFLHSKGFAYWTRAKS